MELKSETQVGSDPKHIPTLRLDIISLRDALEEVFEELDEYEPIKEKIGMLADAFSQMEDDIENLTRRVSNLEIIKNKYIVLPDPIEEPKQPYTYTKTPEEETDETLFEDKKVGWWLSLLELFRWR